MAQYISNLVQDKLFSVNHLMRYVDKNCTFETPNSKLPKISMQVFESIVQFFRSS